MYLVSNCIFLSLEITNFTCFRSISCSFSSGISIITGLSGTGKSLFLTALKLLIEKEIHQENLKLNYFQNNINEPCEIKAKIIPISLISLDHSYENLITDSLQSVIGEDIKNGINISVIIDKHNKPSFSYSINNFVLDHLLYQEWIGILNNNFNFQMTSNYNCVFSSESILSKDLTDEDRYQLFLNQLNLLHSKDRYFNLKQAIAKNEQSLQSFLDTKSRAKEIEEQLEQENKELLEYQKIKKDLELLEEESVWEPINSLENRILALKNTLQTNQSEIDDIQEKIDKKESKREQLLQIINQKSQTEKSLSIDYETVRKEFLEKKSRVDRNQKQIQTWEKMLKRIKFEERQEQMKLNDKKRILDDIKGKISKKSSIELENQFKQLLIEEKSLTQKIKSIKEKYQAISKEKQFKKASMIQIEKEVHNYSSKLQNSKNMLANLKNDNSELIKENDNIYSEIESLKEKIEQLKEQEEKIKKDLKKTEKNLNKERKKLEKTQKIRPVKIRSKHILDKLIKNTKDKLRSIVNKHINFEAEKHLNNHRKSMIFLDEEEEKYEKNSIEIQKQLSSWFKTWNSTLINYLKVMTKNINDFLKPWDFVVKLELNFVESIEKGYFSIKLLHKGQKIPLHYISSTEKIVIDFAWMISLMAVDKKPFLINDEDLSRLDNLDSNLIITNTNKFILEKRLPLKSQFFLTFSLNSIIDIEEDNMSILFFQSK